MIVEFNLVFRHPNWPLLANYPDFDQHLKIGQLSFIWPIGSLTTFIPKSSKSKIQSCVNMSQGQGSTTLWSKVRNWPFPANRGQSRRGQLWQLSQIEPNVESLTWILNYGHKVANSGGT